MKAKKVNEENFTRKDTKKTLGLGSSAFTSYFVFTEIQMNIFHDLNKAEEYFRTNGTWADLYEFTPRKDDEIEIVSGADSVSIWPYPPKGLKLLASRK